MILRALTTLQLIARNPWRAALALSILTAWWGAPRPANAAPPLVVPTNYASIQAAIDAAQSGGTVKVLAGTYTEQIVINKNLTIMGAGMDTTTIRAPAELVNGQLGSPSIVEIYDAAVSMSQLTVAGPGAVACGAVDENGNEIPRLRWGIRVHSEGHLDFGFAAVRDIHDTPMAPCPRSGAGIVVGQPQPGTPVATADIHHSEVTNFQTVGVIAFGVGSWANVTHSIITGPGHAGGVPTDGIELVAGAVGTISHNTVSGNICPDDLPEDCGPDFFTQFQHGGITAGGNGPGTVITHNYVFGNQIGLFLSEVDELSHNVMVANDFFGIGLVGLDTGSFTVAHGRIEGGGGGVWVVPLPPVDMTVTLNKLKLSGLGGPAVEVLECLGATATVIGGPPPSTGVCPP